MSISESHPKWNYNEFVCFLLVYAAHADLEFTAEERKMIGNLISEDQVCGLDDVFSEMTDYERIQTIQSYKELYYPTTERRDELLNKIKTLFESDGHFSIMEQNMMRMLHRIL